MRPNAAMRLLSEIFTLNDMSVRVLFDTGASLSFVSQIFCAQFYYPGVLWVM